VQTVRNPLFDAFGTKFGPGPLTPQQPGPPAVAAGWPPGCRPGAIYDPARGPHVVAGPRIGYARLRYRETGRAGVVQWQNISFPS